MNPIIEEWFIELDEGEEDLRTFIRQVSDVVTQEVGVPAGLIKYLEDRGLALVPISRLWWENPRSQMFSPMRSHPSTPPGRTSSEEAGEEGSLVGDEGDAKTLNEFRQGLRGKFVEGALEGIAVGQLVSFLTHPSGPQHQQDAGFGLVTEIHGTEFTIQRDGRTYLVDVDRGGRVVLPRR